jgi:hypothetical protein
MNAIVIPLPKAEEPTEVCWSCRAILFANFAVIAAVGYGIWRLL